jgi:hypothetical protein
VVRPYGGDIRIRIMPATGSIFIVEIPIAAAALVCVSSSA